MRRPATSASPVVGSVVPDDDRPVRLPPRPASITFALYALKIRAALIISILVTTIIALIAGVETIPSHARRRRPSFSTLGSVQTCSRSSPSSALRDRGPDDLRDHAHATSSTRWARSPASPPRPAWPSEDGTVPGHRPRPARRQRRRDRRRRRRRLVEHDLHRERRRRRRGRPDRLRVGRHRRPVPARDLPRRRSPASSRPRRRRRPSSSSAT